MLRESDTLAVWTLERLGRSIKQLVDLVGELHKQGVQFKSLTDAIDTGTPSGWFFFGNRPLEPKARETPARAAKPAIVKAYFRRASRHKLPQQPKRIQTVLEIEVGERLHHYINSLMSS